MPDTNLKAFFWPVLAIYVLCFMKALLSSQKHAASPWGSKKLCEHSSYLLSNDKRTVTRNIWSRVKCSDILWGWAPYKYLRTQRETQAALWSAVLLGPQPRGWVYSAASRDASITETGAVVQRQHRVLLAAREVTGSCVFLHQGMARVEQRALLLTFCKYQWKESVAVAVP